MPAYSLHKVSWAIQLGVSVDSASLHMHKHPDVKYLVHESRFAKRIKHVNAKRVNHKAATTL